MDHGLAFGSQSGHGEGHGDAVVVLRVDLRAVELLSAGHADAVVMFFDARAHPPQIFCHGGDAV